MAPMNKLYYDLAQIAERLTLALLSATSAHDMSEFSLSKCSGRATSIDRHDCMIRDDRSQFLGLINSK